MYIMSFSSFLFPVMVHQQCETPATWLLLKNIREDKKKVPQTGLRLAANKKKTVVMTQLAWISAVYFLWEKIGSPIEVLEI